ncbi:MAG: cytochrome C biogenesis protein [Candidatus Pelagibacter sp.]|nr:cytochrome C biogenesis protein [Candidatus Pelagibacter sp.]|tara:strand:- start:656 stop:1369 length:714 start_codon:yes stop_codon:yes gene_type:complete
MSLYFISFFAGAVSFLSPCVLPLVPGYISFICGTTLEGLEEQNKSFILKNTLLFAIGFSIVFISLGATATFFGGLLFNYSKIFTVLVGIIIIFFSLNMVGLLQLRLLNQEFRYHFKNYIKKPYIALLIGVGFGFGWSPCIGPILGTILTFASLETTLTKGITLLTIYSLGLGVPFVLSGVYLTRFLIFSKSMRLHIIRIQKISGYILLLTGVLIVTGKLQSLGFFILKYLPFLGKLG